MFAKMRHLGGAVLAALAFFLVPAGPAVANGFDETTFKTWIESRAGTDTPAYWYSSGELTEFPTGRILAKVEGFDTSHLIPDPDFPGGYIQLSRKVYIYRDAKTGEIIREVNGVPLEPILFTYQQIHYRLVRDKLQTISVYGSGDRIRKTGPHEVITTRMVGDTTVFTVPVYRNRVLPNGEHETAFESYDFFTQVKNSNAKYRHQVSFVSSVPAPTALGGGRAYLHQVGWRVEEFDNLPASIRDFVRNEHPLWMAPPHDLAEIAELQGR